MIENQVNQDNIRPAMNGLHMKCKTEWITISSGGGEDAVDKLYKLFE